MEQEREREGNGEVSGGTGTGMGGNGGGSRCCRRGSEAPGCGARGRAAALGPCGLEGGEAAGRAAEEAGGLL